MFNNNIFLYLRIENCIMILVLVNDNMDLGKFILIHVYLLIQILRMY